MTINWIIILTPFFKNELQGIYNYLCSHYENQIALNQIQKIFMCIDSLKQMPNRFSLVKNKKWRKRGLRYMIVENYIVFFYPNEDKKEVIVLHIYYHGRNIPYLLHEKEEILNNNL